MTDSIVQQVREARASIAAEFGYDLSKYLVWIREQTKLRKESLGISKQNETLETTDGASKSSVARKRRGHPARVSA
jgi:hypothetical protein